MDRTTGAFEALVRRRADFGDRHYGDRHFSQDNTAEALEELADTVRYLELEHRRLCAASEDCWRALDLGELGEIRRAAAFLGHRLTRWHERSRGRALEAFGYPGVPDAPGYEQAGAEAAP